VNAVLVGVIGHVDHGKSALVRALTGTQTDRLREERARGVSIVLGFALLRTPVGEIDLVDMPGHERFVRAMISGATGMEAVLLAVDAREGVKPQTLEHLEIARLIGVRRGVVALTKSDLVSEAEAAHRGREAQAAAAAAGIEAPVVATSAVTGQGLAGLAAHLGALLGSAERPANARAEKGFFYLPVDRAFAVAGIGPVVTGTLRRGPLAIGDPVEIMPGGGQARVRGLQIHGRSVESAPPGRRVAVALRGIEMRDLARGLALATPGMLRESAWIDMRLSVSKSAAKPLANGARVKLLFGTSEVEARLRLLQGEEIAPGGEGLAQLRCAHPVAVPAGEPLILRAGSPAVTVGGGRVLDPVSRRRRRHDPAVLDMLGKLAQGRPAEALLARLREAGPAGAALGDLARLVGIAPERVRRRLVALGARPENAERVLHPEAWQALRRAVLDGIEAFHRDHAMEHGAARDRLLAALPAAVDAPIGAAVIADLVTGGALRHERGRYALAAFRPEGEERAATRAVRDAYRRGGLAPPDEAAVAGDEERSQALRFLLRQGVLVRTTDRVQKRTILFHAEAIAQAKQALRQHFGADPFLAREAGALLGISRKFSIPLLEHLDAVKFTRRMGDRRIVVEESGGRSD
jgi:selenocysteine-specific elongation factor